MHNVVGTTHSLVGLAGAASALSRALDSARLVLAREAGLSVTELRAMFIVAESGGTTPKALADSLELAMPTVSTVVAKLADRGLVERAPHPGDRRSLIVGLSDRGHVVMRSTYERFALLIESASGGIVSGARASLEHELISLADGLHGAP